MSDTSPTLPDPPTVHRVPLLLLLLALYATTELALRLPRTPLHPLAPLPPAPAPPRKSAALIYFGTVGSTSYDAKEASLRAGAPWALDAALGARPYIQQHVLDFKAARGWAFDTFMHTWQTQFEAELVALLRPRNASSGPQPLRGALAPTGLAFSVDLALQQMRAHVAGARGGRPYDRVVVLRYDSVFYRGLDLDALTDGEAFYAAAWCKAHRGGGGAPPAVPGTRGCWGTRRYWADEEGLPDFWFAGAPAPVLAVFEGLGARMASGAVRVGRTCNGCGHGQVWGAVRSSGVRLRRWGFHQVDNDLFRDSQCGLKWHSAPLAAVPWVNFTGGDASPGEDSACGGYLCAVDEGELERCAGFKADPAPDWVTMPGWH